MNIQNLREAAAQYKSRLAVAVLAAGPALASAQTAGATGVDASINSAKTEILGYVATAGGAMIAVALAGVGWAVGAKLVKRLRSAA